MFKLTTFLIVIIAFNYSYQLKPNVLLIIVDDLRPSLGVYGDKNARTPNIDTLAKKSAVFTNVFAQQALCAPSRNSFLTSRRPDSLHLYDFYSYWRDAVGNFTTIPQLFKENGYYTHSIGKVFHPGISSNFTDDSEYSWSQTPYHPPTEKYTNDKVCVTRNGLAQNLLCPVIVDEQPGGSLPDVQSLRAAKDFLRYHKQITALPYFLAVGFHKPHIPLRFPIEYLSRYTLSGTKVHTFITVGYHPFENVKIPLNHFHSSGLPNVAWNPWTDIRERDDIKALNISFPFGTISDYTIKRIVQHYNSAVTYVDDLIGELLQSIDKNTIVVILGDHGWSMGEHGEFSKFSNFDIATKVPLIISTPGAISVQKTIPQLVELVDLFPTLVDLTKVTNGLERCLADGSNSKLCTEGKSLVPLIFSKSEDVSEKTAVFTQYPRPGEYPTLKPNSDKPHLKDINIMGYSIRTNQYRYTEWVGFDHRNFSIDWNKVFGQELYDHNLDPNENMNLVTRPEMNEMINFLRKKLRLGWRYI
ncbi:hypothetical protein RI129_007767 [Pyrocoelia pectoralis]|uniref:Sulfatase N-terminal domain-containing protein n=1 Tax=Pyrocoelia pectoralis TaxID=417401 RepID=A0AAN7ZHA9_9COLE